jgi:hypothetical protein
MLTDLIFANLFIPNGTISAQILYAQVGSESTPISVFISEKSSPHINLPIDLNTTRGGTISFHDGFAGYIWAVTEDVDGVEYVSEKLLVKFVE